MVYDNPPKAHTQGYLGDDATYSVDAQKHHSWRFWFRQKDVDPVTGLLQERDIRQTFAPGGRYIHSYVPADFALDYWMRFNDDLKRHGQHYNRPEPSARGNRTLPGASNDPNRDLHLQAALMRDRKNDSLSFRYNHHELNFPAGAVALDYAGSNNNINATAFGWHNSSHGHFLYKDQYGMDASMASIYQWYKEIFRTQGAVPIGTI